MCNKTVEQSRNRGEALEHLSHIETRTGQETLADRFLSEEDVTDTYIRCTEHHDALDNLPIAKGKGKGKGKAEGKYKNIDIENNAGKQGIIEHHGAMCMYKQAFEKSRKCFKQINGRLVQICFKTEGPSMIITNARVPHTWAN